MGVNAVHRLAPVLAVVDGWEGRRPVIDGCEFREALQAVGVEGGVAGNVIPPAATLAVNHRFAPDRTVDEAEAFVRELLAPALAPDDRIELVDHAPAAAPAVRHPLVAGLVARHDLEVRAKLGWTDVARLAAHGVPAVNFGPGDSTLAHTADEHVTAAQLARVHAVLDDLLRVGTDGPRT
jgi:succinyl-diaminopimelate desuccinylase